MTPAAAGDDGSPFAELELHNIEHNGRTITFSTSRDDTGLLPPVLYFYPMGAGRRMLLAFRELFADLRFVCINRPGKGGTSPSQPAPDDDEGTNYHLETTLRDALAVLDHLGIAKISILCMCAGSPSGMAFCAKYPQRTTKQMIGISTWVQPADCGYENTKTLYHIGTQKPSLTGPFAGTFMQAMGGVLSSCVPISWFSNMIKSKLSTDESVVFDAKYKNGDEFSRQVEWMRQDPRGGVNEDLQVLLSANLVDYDALSKSQEHSIVLWHGTNDDTVPYVGAEWLAKKLSTATLNTIQDGTHEGCMFLLHPSIVDSLKSLGRK